MLNEGLIEEFQVKRCTYGLMRINPSQTREPRYTQGLFTFNLTFTTALGTELCGVGGAPRERKLGGGQAETKNTTNTKPLLPVS